MTGTQQQGWRGVVTKGGAGGEKKEKLESENSLEKRG